jgi:hypothetical protein
MGQFVQECMRGWRRRSSCTFCIAVYLLRKCINTAVERARRIPVRCPTQLAGFSSLSVEREKRQERKRLQECKEFFASVAVGNPSSFVPVLAAEAGSGRRYLKREGLRLHVAVQTILQRGHMIELYTAATPIAFPLRKPYSTPLRASRSWNEQSSQHQNSPYVCKRWSRPSKRSNRPSTH